MTDCLTTLDSVSKNIFHAWKPPPKLLISEWADKHGVLTAASSAEPGRWNSYQYQRAWLDAFCMPDVERITILKSARLGYSKVLGHIIGYHIHQDPCSMLVVQPTVGDSDGYSKDEIAPMVAETCVLAKLVGEAKSKSSGNTINQKRYPGGTLHLVGANSPRGFRRITVRIVLFDEVDGYPPTAGSEGDQIKLGTMRTQTFWNRKVALGSTPTIKGESRIEDSFESSSKGYFMLQCPHCQGEHIRLFRQPENPLIVRNETLNVSWLSWQDDDPKTAAWVCPECGGLIDHSHHYAMVEGGYWLGENWHWHRETGFEFELDFTGHIGFSLWAGYSHSPNSTPAKIVKEFLDCNKDHEALKTFINTVLGEPWEEVGEQANDNVLLARREAYPATVPDGVRILTAGVDIQQDRIELEIVGWNRVLESWNIDYIVLPGDTTQPYVWELLDDTLRETHTHQSGAELPLLSVGIDSGYQTKAVYDFVKRFRSDYVFPLKGDDGSKRPIVESDEGRRKRIRKAKRGKMRPELIGVDQAKTLLMNQMKIHEPGPGYCHFPMERDHEYFAQLTAERRVMRHNRGNTKYIWKKSRLRNESLDCRVYALAAIMLLNPDWDRVDYPTAKPKHTTANKPMRKRSTGFGSRDWVF